MVNKNVKLDRQIHDPINPFVPNVSLSERVHWERMCKISMTERFGEIAELMALIQ